MMMKKITKAKKKEMKNKEKLMMHRTYVLETLFPMIRG